jgi:hypothetical protein
MRRNLLLVDAGDRREVLPFLSITYILAAGMYPNKIKTATLKNIPDNTA